MKNNQNQQISKEKLQLKAPRLYIINVIYQNKYFIITEEGEVYVKVVLVHTNLPKCYQLIDFIKIYYKLFFQRFLDKKIKLEEGSPFGTLLFKMLIQNN